MATVMTSQMNVRRQKNFEKKIFFLHGTSSLLIRSCAPSYG